MSQDDILDFLNEDDDDSDEFLEELYTDESDELEDDEPVFPTPAIDVTVSQDRLYAYLTISQSPPNLIRLRLMTFTKPWLIPRLSTGC
jgi:hypothetical protein